MTFRYVLLNALLIEKIRCNNLYNYDICNKYSFSIVGQKPETHPVTGILHRIEFFYILSYVNFLSFEIEPTASAV